MDTIFYIFHVRTTAPPRLARWSSERTFTKISQSRKKLLPGPSPGLLKAPTSTFIYKTLFLLWIWINASLAKCLKRFLNVEAVVSSLSQPAKGPPRGLLPDCENFAKIRCKLYLARPGDLSTATNYKGTARTDHTPPARGRGLETAVCWKIIN